MPLGGWPAGARVVDAGHPPPLLAARPRPGARGGPTRAALRRGAERADGGGRSLHRRRRRWTDTDTTFDAGPPAAGERGAGQAARVAPKAAGGLRVRPTPAARWAPHADSWPGRAGDARQKAARATVLNGRTLASTGRANAVGSRCHNRATTQCATHASDATPPGGARASNLSARTTLCAAHRAATRHAATRRAATTNRRASSRSTTTRCAATHHAASRHAAIRRAIHYSAAIDPIATRSTTRPNGSLFPRRA
jgi:hypothetical protein